MRNQFERQLSQLHEDLIQMGMLIEKSLQRVIDILAEQDEALLHEIKDYEMQVDELERSIQSQALRILFTQQPVARDLRSISTAINLITDMERISDQCYDIAEIAMVLKGKNIVAQPAHIVEMIAGCITMVTGSIDSYVTQNIDTARHVIASDDEVDALFSQIRDELVELINQNKDCGEEAIDYIMIAKYLERIADHSVNIAEWVIFNITGEHKNQKLL